MLVPPVRIAAALLLSGALLLSSPEPQQVFRGRSENVAVPVTVFDPYQTLVTSLTRDDFTVFDNGRRQEITTFSSGLQPIRAVLLLDTSASMMAAIDLARLAAEQFVIRLRPGDRAKVGVFNARVTLSSTLTADRDALLAWLRRDLSFSNPTRLLDAIDEAVTDLLPESGRRVVIVFTDGCDTASETGWSSLINRINAEDVMVYAIGLHSKMLGQVTRPDGNLRRLADSTGGGYFELKSTDDLGPTFTRVAQELHAQLGRGVHQEPPPGQVHQRAAAGARVPRVVRRAHRAPAPQHGDAERGAGAEEGELQSSSTRIVFVLPDVWKGTPAVTTTESPCLPMPLSRMHCLPNASAVS